jgi:hypothetical protein
VSRRLVILAVGGVAVVGAVVPSFAATAPSAPVTVQTSTSDGVSVGVSVFGQPGAGASVSHGGTVCAGVSEQLPVCTPQLP